jgi:TPP-dependent indolepyruvate ferredoxin oxidoreductase alpha subunit
MDEDGASNEVSDIEERSSEENSGDEAFANQATVPVVRPLTEDEIAEIDSLRIQA